MEEFLKYNNLYNIYGSFLTDNQKDIFKLYYEENLNLQEIADIKGTSKSFIGKTVNECKDKLDEFDSKLHLSNISDLLEINDIDKLKKEIGKIIDSWK